MKKLWIFLLILILGFGCNGNAGTQASLTVASPAPGNIQPFDIYVVNNTQWYITLDPLFTGQSVTLIPPGSYLTIHVGYLPASISAYAQTYATPVYVFPTKYLILGRDYGATWTSVTISFP